MDLQLTLEMRKQSSLMEKENCAVMKVVNLPHEKFDRFKNDFMREYDFINNNIDIMKNGTNETFWGCVLVMPEDGDEGIICHKTSMDMPLYTSYLPQARGWYVYQSKMSDALRDFETYMQSAAEYVKTAAINENLGGRMEFNRDTVENLYSDGYPLNFFILAEMLKENGEISNAIIDGDTLKIITSSEVERYPEKFMNDVMKDDLEVKYAKHLLTIHGENVDEIFDLSNFIVHNVDFSHRELNGAVFKNTTFKNCKFDGASMCFGDFENAKFSSCSFVEMDAEEANFTNASFVDCNLKKAWFAHSKFGDVSMDKCNINHACFMSCYVERFKRTNCQEFGTNFSGLHYDMNSYEGISSNETDEDDNTESFEDAVRSELDYEED